MIDSKVFYQRRGICTACPYWKGVCLKGHALSSPMGCPEKRFPPVEGAAYMPDRPATVAATKPSTSCCGGSTLKEDLREVSYAEAARNLATSIKEWATLGFPLVTENDYNTRVSVCKNCGFYRWHQCRLCKCIIVVKAKLQSSKCPGNFWSV